MKPAAAIVGERAHHPLQCGCFSGGAARPVWGDIPRIASRQHIPRGLSGHRASIPAGPYEYGGRRRYAVTRGPGLPGSLVVGVNAAKGLAIGSGLPLVGINHLEAHLYSAWLYQAEAQPQPEPEFPLIAFDRIGWSQ